MSTFLIRTKQIFSAYSFGEASAVFIAYIAVLFGARFSKVRESRQQFLGMTALFPRRHGFFSQFVELFVERAYRFDESNKKPHILDCGSNIGMSMLYFKWRRPEAHLVCIEANPEAMTYVQKNIEANGFGDVRTEAVAAGRADGTAEFHIESDVPASPGASLYRTIGAAGTISVPVRRLSSFVTEPVDLIKLDIEGAEYEVMQELSEANVLGKVKEFWIEYHPDASSEAYEGITTILKNAGFTVAHPTDTHKAFLIHAVRPAVAA
jgi:FkbM family methyltransferase